MLYALEFLPLKPKENPANLVNTEKEQPQESHDRCHTAMDAHGTVNLRKSRY
jgi:hypothetical protein